MIPQELQRRRKLATPQQAIQEAATQPTTVTELKQQGYVYEPSGYYTYGVPQEVGYYVKYEAAPQPQPEARQPMTGPYGAALATKLMQMEMGLLPEREPAREPSVVGFYYRAPAERALLGETAISRMSAWWAATPSVADIKALETRKEAVAVPFREQEAFLIISVVSLGYGLAKAVYHLPGKIKLATHIGKVEKLRHELYGKDYPTFIQSPDKEFLQQVLEPTPTKPALETWYRVYRGTPTTPMSKTLEAAVYGKAMGGLSAEQILVPRSTWVMPPALKEIVMVPKAIPSLAPSVSSLLGISLATPALTRSLLITKTIQKTETIIQVKPERIVPHVQRVETIQIQRLKPKAVQRLQPMQISRVEPMQAQALSVRQATRQIQQQTQRLSQIQMVKMATPSIQRAVTIQRFPQFRMPKFPSVSRLEKGLRGAWFKKVHPIKTPEEMMATFGFGPRRRRGKRRGVK